MNQQHTAGADVHPRGHSDRPGCAGGDGPPYARLLEASLALWERTEPAFPRLGERVGPYRRWRNTRTVGALIDQVADEARTCPDDGGERAEWRASLRQRALQVGRDHLGWTPQYGQLIAGDAFYTSAESFAREARTFDPALPLEDLGQALRNVWVGNSLQMLVGAPVRLTPALFAYSMLYPTTDNVLDDPSRSGAAKRAFNARLAGRLRGDMPPPADAAEEKPWALVAVLEREYPRMHAPHVWRAILGIHHAQVDSLRQQQDHTLSPRALLALTMAKGGASVLADLHLVAPSADPAAAAFAFRYGMFLQMLDDLQDVDADLDAGHETPFTHAARCGHLDTLTGRLVTFIDVVLDRYAHASRRPCADVLELIRYNCRALVVGVMARQPKRFSWPLRRRVASQWPVGLHGMRRLLDRGQRRLLAVQHDLQRTRGLASPLELLLSAPDRATSRPEGRIGPSGTLGSRQPLFRT